MESTERSHNTMKVRNGQTADGLPECETAQYLSAYARIEIAGMANDFYFNRLEFEKFCRQLCKEQRKICQRISITQTESRKRAHMISNAPEPKFL